MEADLDELAPIGPLTEWLDANIPELGKGPLKRDLLHGDERTEVFFKPSIVLQDATIRSEPVLQLNG